MKTLLTPLLLVLLALLQGCILMHDPGRTISKGDLMYYLINVEYFSNGKYKGELKDGLPHGKGTMTYIDGDKYVGEWKNNTLNGNGTYTWTNGDKYVGEWKDNLRNGQGTMTYASGAKYEGEWKTHLKNGTGTATWGNGDKYSGAFDMAIMENITSSRGVAEGVYTYADGRKYEGEIQVKSPHGKGTMTFPDGKIQSGIWDDGAYLYDLAEHQKREEQRLTLLRQEEKQKREAQLAAKKQRILSKLKPYMDDCLDIGFKVDSKKYRECIVESI